MLRDAKDALRIIKNSAKKTQNASKPTDVVYGMVISVSPLRVQVDQKFTLEEYNLKLTRAVMDYEVEMTVDHVTETSVGGNGDAEFASHKHEYKGRKKFLIHNGLVKGDRVTMIRAHGGQQFLIIDKEVV